jgi:hypothetical protein
MVRCAEKSPPSHGTDCGRGGVSVHCRPITAAAGENRAPPRIAAKRPTLYPPPPNPLRSVITLYPLRSHHSSLAPPCARRLPISATLYLISPPLLPPGRPNAAKPPTPCCARLHLYPPCIRSPLLPYRSHLIPPPPFRLLPTRALAAPSSPYPRVNQETTHPH